MNPYTKLTQDGTSYPWEVKDTNALMHWANRDEHNTKWAVKTPTAVRSVGEPLNYTFNSRNQPAENHVPNLSQYVQIPAIMTLDMVPTYAVVKTEGAPDVNPYEERIDINIWDIKYRDLASMVKVTSFQFEPITLQFCHVTITEIISHVAHLLRGMDAYCETGNPNNVGALTSDYLLNAMGFTGGLGVGTGTLQSTGNGIDDLILFVNKFIIGPLRQNYWFWDLIPGTFYWAGLYSKIYMDENAENCTASSYIFRPKYFFNPQIRDSDSTFYMDPVLTSGFTTLWDYADAISQAIRFIINNEDFRNVQITLEQLNQKSSKYSDVLNFSYGNFDFYPYVGRPTYFTYDPAMLIAIHNLTVVTGGSSSAIREVVGTGDARNQLVQEIWMNPNDQLDQQYLKMRTAIDMPRKLTCDDWDATLVATQFTVTSWDGQPVGEYQLSPKVLGLAVCVSAGIIVYLDPFNNDSFNRIEYKGYVNLARSATLRDDAFMISYVSQFNYAPLTPILYTSSLGDWESAEIAGWINDLSQIHVMDFNTLESAKVQLYYNAFGYPIRIPTEGSFEGANNAIRMYSEALSANVIMIENGSDTEKTPSDAPSTQGDTSTSKPKRPGRSGDWKKKKQNKNKVEQAADKAASDSESDA